MYAALYVMRQVSAVNIDEDAKSQNTVNVIEIILSLSVEQGTLIHHRMTVLVKNLKVTVK
jgi:hypothetical protein